MHTAMMDEARTAEAVMSAGLTGRRVTRVLLDYAVTLQFWLNGEQTREIKLETPFDIAKADGSRLTVNPGDLADAALQVAELHARTVSNLAIRTGNELRVGLDDGRVILAPPDGNGTYESWSYAMDDGTMVICLPSGGLSLWGPRQE